MPKSDLNLNKTELALSVVMLACTLFKALESFAVDVAGLKKKRTN